MYYERPFLEKGSKKYICPSCTKKTFKPYVLGGKHIHETVGICDRILSCGYHKPPREYWQENNIKMPKLPTIQRQPPKKQEIKPIGYMSAKYISTYSEKRNNNLIYYLLDLFDSEIIKTQTDPYLLGCAKGGDVIYWQIDQNMKCRTGKIQKLDKETGKRFKSLGSVRWVHAKLKDIGELPQDFNMQMCLFGLHLIHPFWNNSGKTICICESEKSAVIAACCMPQYIWMAAGALHWLNVEKLKPLKGWDVVLFPDTSTNGKAFELWSKIAEEANRQGLNVIVSDMLEKNCTEEQKADGYDIADYLIDEINAKKKAEECKSIEPEAKEEPKQAESGSISDTLEEMIRLNSAIQTLINEFDAVEVATTES